MLGTEAVEKYIFPQETPAVQLRASRDRPPASLRAEPPCPAVPDRLWQEVAWGGHTARLVELPGWPSLGSKKGTSLDRKQGPSPGPYGGGSGVPACSALGLLFLPQAAL